SERQTVYLFFLRIIFSSVVSLSAWSRFMPQRQPAEFRCGGNISLHERRRDLQSTDDVIEAAAGILGRKERSRVNFQGEEFSNRIRILGAVHPMDAGRRQFRIRSGSPVEFIFKRDNELVVICAARPR